MQMTGLQQPEAAAKDHTRDGQPKLPSTPRRPRPLQAQTNLQQLLPTLVGDQIPRKPYSCYKAGLQRCGGDPIRLIDVEDLQDTVPWDPAAATPRQPKQEETTRGAQALWTPAGAYGRHPSAESEDEAWGHARRRRTADTPMDSATPPTARRGQQLSSGADPPPEQGT